MSYKDAKIRICPMCGKNVKDCQCEKAVQQTEQQQNSEERKE